MTNDFFKLPFTFNVKNLLEDLNKCDQYGWTPHFNDQNYKGNWNSIALRSIDGQVKTIFAHAMQDNAYKDTMLLSICPYFKQIIDSFKCDKESIRLLKLHVNSEIKEHRDHKLGYEDGVFRIHIPIQTNDQAFFYINGSPLQIEAAECWYMNFNLIHSAINHGNTSRVHLVMDCIRNDWSDELFKRAGYNFDLEKVVQRSHSEQDTLRMIEELKRMNTQVSLKLIKQLESELFLRNHKAYDITKLGPL
jgi:hypothetical protein